MQVGQSLNSLKDGLGVESVDYSADFNNMSNKLDKRKLLYDRGSMDPDMIRYIPGLARIFYQGQLEYASSTYSDKNIL